MRQFLVNLQNYVGALIEAAKRSLQGAPKFYDKHLETMVRERLQGVTERLNKALDTARANRTVVQVPNLDPEFGQVDMNIELTNQLADGIIKVSYTGPQARSYQDVLNKGVKDICTVLETDFDPGLRGEHPTFTAQLQLPVRAFFFR